MIALMALLRRAFVGRGVEGEARRRLAAQAAEAAQAAGEGEHCAHHDHGGGSSGAAETWRERLTSAGSWRAVAAAFVADWRMLWKEIVIGFVLAGFIAQIPD